MQGDALNRAANTLVPLCQHPELIEVQSPTHSPWHWRIEPSVFVPQASRKLALVAAEIIGHTEYSSTPLASCFGSPHLLPYGGCKEANPDQSQRTTDPSSSAAFTDEPHLAECEFAGADSK